MILDDGRIRCRIHADSIVGADSGTEAVARVIGDATGYWVATGVASTSIVRHGEDDGTIYDHCSGVRAWMRLFDRCVEDGDRSGIAQRCTQRWNTIVVDDSDKTIDIY